MFNPVLCMFRLTFGSFLVDFQKCTTTMTLNLVKIIFLWKSTLKISKSNKILFQAYVVSCIDEQNWMKESQRNNMIKNEKNRKTNKYRKTQKKEKDTSKNPQCFPSFYLFKDVVFHPFVILKMGKKSKKVFGTKQ